MNNRVAMIVFAYYPEDRRVRRAAEAVVAAGTPVDVICLRKREEPPRSSVEGVSVYRMPLVRKRGSMLRYLWEYAVFFALASVALAALHLRRRYAVVHVHNMPDLLVICTLVPKLAGAKVILDLHDPMPEMFMTKYGLPWSHPVARFLRSAESFSVRYSDLVITTNIAFRNLFISRGCPPGKVHIVMNTPDPSRFGQPHRPDGVRNPGEPAAYRIMFHGAIFRRQGLDVALEAILLLRDRIPRLAFDVYGDGDDVGRFVERIDSLRLRDIVRYHGFVPPHLMSAKIEPADAGLIPNPRNAFTDINLPTRIFEYLCMGKPVIVPRTRGILDYFDDTSIFFFEPDNPSDLASVILGVYRDPGRRGRVLENGVQVLRNHRWEVQAQRLTRLVGTLADGMTDDPLCARFRGEALIHRGIR